MAFRDLMKRSNMLLGGKYSSLQVEVPPKETRMEEEMEQEVIEQGVLAEDITAAEGEIDGEIVKVATTLHSNNGDKRKGQEELSKIHKKSKGNVLKNITTYADKVVEASKKVN